MENGKRKTENGKRANLFCRVLISVLCSVFFVFSIDAQSTDQSFPTPVSTNEIEGKIAARDLGDARLTTYFYVFNGGQGDIFINVKTANLDGDIDVFAVENLRPLTKITVFSDASQNETGRVIYLRKPEKLILRVQGRTPNDAAATFNLKFAGSFAPAASVAGNDAPELPEIKTENQGDVIVNSVGTIIGVKPKPTPAPKEIVAENEPSKEKPKKPSKKIENKKTETPETEKETVAEKSPIEDAENPPKPTVAAAENSESENANLAENKPAKTPSARRNAKSGAAKNADKNTAAGENKKPAEPNPLESVRLLIVFKDGTKIERPMSEVLRVGVDRGVLTLITKDGKIARYPILDVAKMTIE